MAHPRWALSATEEMVGHQHHWNHSHRESPIPFTRLSQSCRPLKSSEGNLKLKVIFIYLIKRIIVMVLFGTVLPTIGLLRKNINKNSMVRLLYGMILDLVFMMQK